MPNSEIVCRPSFYGREFPSPEEQFCFVIMPFDDPLLDDVYHRYVKPTITSLGLSCIRGDDIFSTTPIMEDIWASLCRCALVVGEFTGRNPNVLYEAGITHTLGKPLVGITQTMEDIPFDFRHLRMIKYVNSPSGYESLTNSLRRTVDTTLAEGHARSPKPFVEPRERLEALLRMVMEEREGSQRLYAAMEERQRRQYAHFHKLVRPRTDKQQADGPKLELCSVAGCTVSVDTWDEERHGAIQGRSEVVASFEITRFPITNENYLHFVRSSGHYPPEHWGGDGPPADLWRLPVVGASWNDVHFYCDWLGELLGRTVRLPTEAEWLAAAGYGTDRRRFPWGDRWQNDACNSAEAAIEGLTPVDRFARGASPSGCMDMLGNVWEWTSSTYDTDGHVPWKAVRGGANYTPLADAGSLARLVAYPGHFLFVRDLGFRVLVERGNHP